MNASTVGMLLAGAGLYADAHINAPIAPSLKSPPSKETTPKD